MRSTMPWVMRMTRTRGDRLRDVIFLTTLSVPHDAQNQVLQVGNPVLFPPLYSDAIVSQVLDELGLNLSDELSGKKTFLVRLS